MLGVRSLAARLKRIEAARAMVSPIQRAYGSLEAFEEQSRAGIEAGSYDPSDMPVVIAAVRGWHTQGLFGMWHRDRIWELRG